MRDKNSIRHHQLYCSIINYIDQYTEHKNIECVQRALLIGLETYNIFTQIDFFAPGF